MKLTVVLCSLSLLAGSLAAYGQATAPSGLKIATVDVAKIVENSVRVKKIREEGEASVQTARQKKNQKEKELEDADQQLKELRSKSSDPSMSTEARTKVAQEWRDKRDKLQMDAAKFTDALQKETQEIQRKAAQQSEKFLSDVYDVATKTGKAKGYNLVLDKSKGRGVIFEELGQDLTEEVMRQVDAMTPAK